MTQEIEIEFKTLIHPKDFEKLLNELPFPNQPVQQENHYFDTKNMTLKQHASALRIREKNRSCTLTLKQPHEKGILETHDTLSQEECRAWLKNKPVAKQNNASSLAMINVQVEDLMYYGSLHTERYAFKDGTLEFVLDRSDYLGVHDYEFELEAESYEAGAAAFKEVLTQYSITKQSPITKIERFFRRLEEQGDKS